MGNPFPGGARAAGRARPRTRPAGCGAGRRRRPTASAAAHNGNYRRSPSPPRRPVFPCGPGEPPAAAELRGVQPGAGRCVCPSSTTSSNCTPGRASKGRNFEIWPPPGTSATTRPTTGDRRLRSRGRRRPFGCGGPPRDPLPTLGGAVAAFESDEVGPSSAGRLAAGGSPGFLFMARMRGSELSAAAPPFDGPSGFPAADPNHGAPRLTSSPAPPWYSPRSVEPHGSDEAMNEIATTAERQMLRNLCDRIAHSAPDPR